MRYLLILLISIALVKGLEYKSQEYNIRYSSCNGDQFNLQEGNCVNVNVDCVKNKYLTIEKIGESFSLKTYNQSGCGLNGQRQEAESAVTFVCDDAPNNIPNGSVFCSKVDMGVFYSISSDSCPGISGELNTCISFNGEERCGYKSARFSGSGDSPTFYGYSNTFCGNNENEDIISQFGVSCIKSGENKAFDLECSDTSSASSLFYTSSLSVLLFVILFFIF